MSSSFRVRIAFLLLAVLVLGFHLDGAVASVGWKLWRGNSLLGVVPLREGGKVSLVSLQRLGEVLDCEVQMTGETLSLTKGKRTVEFIPDAAMARSGASIFPLANKVLIEGDTWWIEAKTVLSLLNRAAPEISEKRLKWAGEEDVAPEKAPAEGTAPQASKAADSGDSGEGVDAGAPVSVRRIRWGRDAGVLRVVFDLSANGEPRVEKKDGELRLQFNGAALRNLSGASSPYPDEAALSMAQIGNVLTCTFAHKAENVKTFFLPDPPRFVVDFGGADSKEAGNPSGASQENALPDVAVEPSAAAEGKALDSGGGDEPSEKPDRGGDAEIRGGMSRRAKPLVAIDAGHGGKDPGAMGNGLREKEINILVAHRLAKLLNGCGFEARLTRADDTYLKLRERTDLANGADADLFVSLHCNALPKGKHARGVEIYIMALPTDKDAMELALFENRELGEDHAEDVAASDKKTRLLLQILGDMQQNAKVSDSMNFAEVLFNKGKASGLNMKRVAQAPFFVLRGAGMPAVLVEMGFISEGSDAALLGSAAFQDKMAQALAQGIAAYMGK